MTPYKNEVKMKNKNSHDVIEKRKSTRKKYKNSIFHLFFHSKKHRSYKKL